MVKTTYCWCPQVSKKLPKLLAGPANIVHKEIWTDDVTSLKLTPNNEFLGVHIKLLDLTWFGSILNSFVYILFHPEMSLIVRYVITMTEGWSICLLSVNGTVTKQNILSCRLKRICFNSINPCFVNHGFQFDR